MADNSGEASATISYYATAAARYDAAHDRGGDEHHEALGHIASIAGEQGLRTFLDVGCGTGRATLFLQGLGLEVHGIDPSPEMIEHARAKGVPRDRTAVGRGEALPHAAASFDAVCACGTMHHVSQPDLIVREMMRVARHAVFISDSNRFGQGGLAARWAKLLLWRAGLWRAAQRIRTRGRGYTFSEADGYSYSYSVYDSVATLARWAGEVRVIPTGRKLEAAGLPAPLRATHGLLLALRQPSATS